MAAVGVGNRGFSGEVEILASGQYGSGGYKSWHAGCWQTYSVGSRVHGWW